LIEQRFLLCDVEQGGATMGCVGRHVVVLDGKGRPRAISRTRGDWLAMHVGFFAARAKAEDFTFNELKPAVFERFTLVWPLGDADPEGAGRNLQTAGEFR